MAVGYLIVNVYADTIALPVNDAEVKIHNQIKIVKTDENGKTEAIELEAPNLELSEVPQHDIRPFSTYDITISKRGFVPLTINGVEIYPNITSFQNAFLTSIDETDSEEIIIKVDEPTLWKDYAPKTEDETSIESSITSFVLPQVIVPSYIIVHDGIPSNTNAPNYYVLFVDYIKNVACNEIYATWTTEAIKANVHAIVSFTLNRIFTEWYRSKGYNFTITSTTTYDQKYTHGRTTFDSINRIVDNYFSKYIGFPNRIEPFLAHYNDGIKLNNPGWLSQWGSQELGKKGYSAIQILRHYYGNSLELREAIITGDYPSSFPGYNISLGSCGEAVLKIQNELNKIRGSYPGIPAIKKPDGTFNQETKNAVETFQKVFNLATTGIIDFATWYKISYVYVAVTKMTEATYK